MFSCLRTSPLTQLVLKRLFVFLTEHTNVSELSAALDSYKILEPSLMSKHIS